MTPELVSQRLGEQCWTTIGVAGDQSCVELERLVHCRNCEVFAAAGRGLSTRSPPAGYEDEQTAQVAEPSPRGSRPELAVLVFRLGAEWLAIDLGAVVEVVADRPVHAIPHRTGGILEGLVQVHGKLLLAVSLARLLGVELDRVRPAVGRLIVARSGVETWAFPVDEVDDVCRCHAAELESVPVTVAAALGSHSASILTWRGRKIGCLAADRLFATLSSSIQAPGKAHGGTRERSE